MHEPAAPRPLADRILAVSDRIPLPAIVRRNITRGDAAFIAAAYMIPLPGTALLAALVVGLRHAIRNLLVQHAAARG